MRLEIEFMTWEVKKQIIQYITFLNYDFCIFVLLHLWHTLNESFVKKIKSDKKENIIRSRKEYWNNYHISVTKAINNIIQIQGFNNPREIINNSAKQTLLLFET